MAKTDALDVPFLAQFTKAVQREPHPPADPQTERLAALVTPAGADGEHARGGEAPAKAGCCGDPALDHRTHHLIGEETERAGQENQEAASTPRNDGGMERS